MITKINPLRYNASKRVMTLMSGTMVAQIIPVTISPILTRIYSPAEFGSLALYLAILAVVSVLGTMRYELAIVQSKSTEDAKALLHLCLVTSASMSFFFLIVVVVYDYMNFDWFDSQIPNELLYLLPVSLFLNGFVLSFRYWLLRQNQFGKLTGTAVAQSGGTGTGQISIGLGQTSNGLIFGQVLGQFLAGFYMVIAGIKTDKRVFRGYSWSLSRRQAGIFSNMPKYSLVGSMADVLAVQLPVLFITKIFNSVVTGYFSLTVRVLNLPLVALSGALSQVLFKKVSDLALTNPERIKPLLIKIHLVLVCMMIPFVALFFLWGEDLFGFVFGENWRQAGYMASVLVFGVAVRFSVSPLSIVMAMKENVRLGMYWQLAYVLTLSTTLFAFREAPIEKLVLVFVCHDSLLYLVYFFLILKGAEKLKEAS
jgi:cbb3-type cytochrome oxidase maturation protein